MIFGFSTQVFFPQRLSTAHLDALASAGAQVIELFAGRHHLDYTDRAQVREIAAWFRSSGVRASLHAPLSADEHFSRFAAPTLNLVAGDKMRRIEAMEETKRALELAEQIAMRTCVLHLGLAGDEWSEYTLEYSLNAVEHLNAFAAPLGVDLLLENLTHAVATPEHLLEVLSVGHFTRCGLCLDIGHLHIVGKAAAEAIDLAGARLRELHLSDNDGHSDAHLWPASGTERPAAMARGDIDWPALYRLCAALPAEIPCVFEVADTQAESAAGVSRLGAEVISHALRLALE